MQKTWRVITGVMGFENDWPGVFIRGDEALGYAGRLKFLLTIFEARARKLVEEGRADDAFVEEAKSWGCMHELADLLASCRVKSRKEAAIIETIRVHYVVCTAEPSNESGDPIESTCWPD